MLQPWIRRSPGPRATTASPFPSIAYTCSRSRCGCCGARSPTGKRKAWNGRLRTEQIWTDERQGLGVGSFLVVDATAAQHASDYLAFSCSKASGIKSDIGFDPSAINVYLVDTVDFGNGAASTNGVWCEAVCSRSAGTAPTICSRTRSGTRSASPTSNSTLFANQLRRHQRDASREQRSQDLPTEGGTFRAGPCVPIRSWQSSRRTKWDDAALHQLDLDTSNTTCPPVDKRIWADGARAGLRTEAHTTMQRVKREDAIWRMRPAARRRSLAFALLVAVAGSRAIRTEVAAAQSAAAPNAWRTPAPWTARGWRFPSAPTAARSTPISAPIASSVTKARRSSRCSRSGLQGGRIPRGGRALRSALRRSGRRSTPRSTRAGPRDSSISGSAPG